MTLSSVSRRPALALLAAFTLGAPTAHAIWLPPDVVEIPTDRLIANLERALADAAPDARPALHLKIARIHAAAYAQKSERTEVQNPVRWSTKKPTIDGPHQDGDVRGALGYLYGRGGNLFAVLRRAQPYDARYGCDTAQISGPLDLSGEVTVRFTIPRGDGPGSQVQPEGLVVTRSTVDSKALSLCLRAKLSEAARFVAKDTPSAVELTFTFAPMGGDLDPFFGFSDVTVPQSLAPATSDEERHLARRHLDGARKHYELAVAAVPEDRVARLGLAWTLEQLGDKTQAIAAYRETFRRAWEVEQKLEHLQLGQRPIAAEAASYLIPLLDPTRDAAEIAELEAATRKLRALPRPVTPIVMPLDPRARSLAALVDPASEVRFDLDGSGLPKRWGWLRDDAAWLVWDPAARGAIASGLQLFGSVSFWVFWQDGYEALAALDDDGDGQLRGAELTGLALWHDADLDGQSAPGEVTPLDRAGIVALDTRATRGTDGVLGAARGVTFADGSTRPTWDWVPTSRELDTPEPLLQGSRR